MKKQWSSIVYIFLCDKKILEIISQRVINSTFFNNMANNKDIHDFETL